ncbi:MAG: hypothetical protein KDA83_01385, partial [Planctomycetales bacterium]|nr:hypothetical protein [Planctomycetales bacterium]
QWMGPRNGGESLTIVRLDIMQSDSRHRARTQDVRDFSGTSASRPWGNHLNDVPCDSLQAREVTPGIHSGSDVDDRPLAARCAAVRVNQPPACERERREGGIPMGLGQGLSRLGKLWKDRSGISDGPAGVR